MLEPRNKIGANFTAVKFSGSPHVAHIKHFREEYKTQVLTFLDIKQATDLETEEETKENEKDSRPKMVKHSLQPKFL